MRTRFLVITRNMFPPSRNRQAYLRIRVLDHDFAKFTSETRYVFVQSITIWQFGTSKTCFCTKHHDLRAFYFKNTLYFRACSIARARRTDAQYLHAAVGWQTCVKCGGGAEVECRMDRNEIEVTSCGDVNTGKISLTKDWNMCDMSLNGERDGRMCEICL